MSTTAASAMKTPLEMLYAWEASRPNELYASQPIAGEWINYSWKEFATEVRKMATVLRDKGFPKGSSIALVSKNCVHWLMADMAIMMAGHVSVPIYPNVNAETVDYILKHSEAKLLFIGKLDKLNWDEMQKGVPASMDCITFPRYGQAGYPTWDEVTESAAPMAEKPVPNLDDIFTIIYTSGTTGVPKGVVHKYISPVFAIHKFQEYFNLGPGERFFSYLPLSHIAERMLIEMGTLVTGGTVHFAESLDSFNANLKHCGPTVFLGVPRIWTKFQMGVLAKFSPSKLNLLLAIPILGGIIRKKIQEALGLDKARVCLTGAAPMPASLLKWYNKIGILIHEVYGMTENSAYSHANTPGAVRFGTVGKTLQECETRFTEDGEIVVKSVANMVGYYKEPEKTAETLKDGWLYTGDVGEMDKDGFVRITGRVKDNFKSSKGKYVVPNPIELKFAQNENIEQCCVVGTGIPQPLILVVLSEGARTKAREEVTHSLEHTLSEVNPTLDDHEKLQNIVVVKEPWTPENNVLTPTLKIKRNVVDKLYGANYEAWYKKGKGVVWE